LAFAARRSTSNAGLSKEAAMRHANSLSTQLSKPVVLSSLLTVACAVAPMAWASTNSDLPAAQQAGSVTYLSGGSAPAQQQAMQRDAKQYPLELQFLWGRGAKETPVTASRWSIRDAKTGDVLASGQSGGPIVLASLPNGRYAVLATYDGTTLKRYVPV